jgi:hypothetical protein
MLQYSTLDLADLTSSTHDLAVAAVSPDMNTLAACICSHLQALGGLLFHYRSVFIPFCLLLFCSGLGLFYKCAQIRFTDSGVSHTLSNPSL